MQGLGIHNLTGITGAPADFLIQLLRNLLQTFIVECTFDRLGLVSKIPKLRGSTATDIARCLKKSIHCLTIGHKKFAKIS